jgi:hypothetical protein
MMGIDQAGQHDVPAQIKDLVGFGREALSRANLLNHIATAEDATIRNFTPIIIHGDEDTRIANK